MELLDDHAVLVVHGAAVADRVLEAAPLRLVCCARKYVNVDVTAAEELGVTITTTPGKNARAVVELTLGFLIMLARGVSSSQRTLLNGTRLGESAFEGAEFFGVELPGRTIGLVGYGNVGRGVAKVAGALGMRVLAYDPGLPKEAFGDVEAVTLDDLLARSDFVSLHARVTPENENLMNAESFARMRPGSFFINTARETLVDEPPALLDAIRSRARRRRRPRRRAPRAGRGPQSAARRAPHRRDATHRRRDRRDDRARRGDGGRRDQAPGRGTGTGARAMSDAATTELDRLVARSRRIGADPALVVHGGGNTSTKLRGVRPPRARAGRHVGQGQRHRFCARSAATGFPGLFLDELLPLQERDDDERRRDGQPISPHCMTDPAARRPSIETLLHAFLPARHVDHTHADSICALTNHPEGRRSVAEALGTEVALVPYLRPGFELSRRTAEHADARAVVLEYHGLVTWGDEHERSYGDTVELDALARAYLDEQGPSRDPVPAPELSDQDAVRLLTALRERLSAGGRRKVLHVEASGRALADRPDVDVVAAGRGTPDHLLRIGVQSIVARSAADVNAAVDAFERDYRAYFERHRHRLPDGFTMLEPLPRVVLVPGLGIVAAGPRTRPPLA